METTYNTNPVKSDKELVKFHKQLLTKFLKDETRLEFRQRVAILALYKATVNDKNIRFYFNAKIRIFLAALITDKLESIKTYYMVETE